MRAVEYRADATLIERLKDEIERQARRQGAYFERNAPGFEDEDGPRGLSTHVTFRGTLDLEELTSAVVAANPNRRI